METCPPPPQPKVCGDVPEAKNTQLSIYLEKTLPQYLTHFYPVAETGFAQGGRMEKWSWPPEKLGGPLQNKAHCMISEAKMCSSRILIGLLKKK